MKKSQKNSTASPKKRKLRRFVLWGFAVVLTLIVLGFFVVLLFPKEKAGLLLAEKMSVAMGRPVRIERVSVNPLGRIDIRGVEVGFPEGLGAKEDRFFRLNRLGVQFRLLSLLRRRLDITGLLIDDPQLHIVSQPPEGERGKKTTKKTEQETQPPKTTLPLSFGLFRLVLNDFRFAMTVPNPAGETRLSIDGVHLEASDLRFPRDYTDAPEDLRGKIRLVTRQSEFVLQSPGVNLFLNVDLILQAEWKRERHWSLNVDLGLKPAGSQQTSPTHLGIGWEGIGYGETIRVRETTLSVGQQRMLRVEGEIDRLGPNMSFDLSFGGDDLDVGKIVETLEELLPPRWIEPLVEIQPAGVLALAEGGITGELQRFRFQCRTGFKKGRLAYKPTGVSVKQGHLDAKAEGVWTRNGLEEGRLLGNLNIGRFDYSPNDTVSFPGENLFLRWNTALDSHFFPVEGFLKGSVAHLLGGSLGLDFHWAPGRNPRKIHPSIGIDGTIRGDSLLLEKLPNIPPGTAGQVHLLVDCQTRTLDDAQIRVDVQTPGIVYGYDQKPEKSPPLRFIADMALRADPQFQTWMLDSATLSLNDLFSAELAGNFAQPNGDFVLALQKARLRNDGTLDLLPTTLREQTAGMNVWGSEEVSGTIRGERTEDATAVSLDGNLKLVGVGFDYPVQGLKIEEMEGEVRFAGPPDRLSGQGEILTGKIFVERMRSEPITGSRLSLDWRMASQDSIQIERGTLDVESMGVKSDFSFRIGQMTEARRMDADVGIIFDAADFVEWTQGVSTRGKMIGRFRAETIEPEKQWFRLSGNIQTDSLSVVKDGAFALRQINGRIPFQFDADQLRKRFLPDSTRRPLTWVAYENRRRLYQNLLPSIERLSIEEIEWADYRMTDLILDMDVGGGYVQIPWFNINLLDGNFGGSLLLNLGTGLRTDIRYEIRAQASRINSAALSSRKVDEEKAELNATLSFRGKGIDLTRGIDLDGYFHITKIGPRFASELLTQMDPTGADRSIRLTRRLLNTGWKPKLFSFELRHGYIYPSLTLSQPWFSPIRIPEQLEYGRLPIEFFLKSRTTSE